MDELDVVERDAASIAFNKTAAPRRRAWRTLAAIEADRVSCRDTCSESGFGCGDACDASAGLLSAVVTAGLIFMIPTLAFAIVSFILEIILAVKCNAAKRAIESGKGPQA